MTQKWLVPYSTLFLCDERMNKDRIFTKEKIQAGKEELLDRTARLFERNSEAVVVEDDGETQRSNTWSKIKDTRDEGSQTDLVTK